jgi:hypothetical protein
MATFFVFWQNTHEIKCIENFGMAKCAKGQLRLWDFCGSSFAFATWRQEKIQRPKESQSDFVDVDQNVFSTILVYRSFCLRV